MTDANYAVTSRGSMNVQHSKCVKYSTKLYLSQTSQPLVLTQVESLVVSDGIPVDMGQAWTLNPRAPHKGV